MEEEILIPIVVFGTIALVVWLFLHFGFRRRLVVHETIRLAIQNGQQISAETIHNLADAADRAIGDLRRGVVFVSVGISFALLSALFRPHDGDASTAMIGIAIFPFMLGVAYLGLWFFTRDRRAN